MKNPYSIQMIIYITYSINNKHYCISKSMNYDDNEIDFWDNKYVIKI